MHRSSFLPTSLADTEPPNWGILPFPSNDNNTNSPSSSPFTNNKTNNSNNSINNITNTNNTNYINHSINNNNNDNIDITDITDNIDNINNEQYNMDYLSPQRNHLFSPKPPQISKGIYKITPTKKTLSKELRNNHILSTIDLESKPNHIIPHEFPLPGAEDDDFIRNFIDDDFFSADVTDTLSYQEPSLNISSFNSLIPLENQDNNLYIPPVSLFSNEGIWTYFIDDRITFPSILNKKLEEYYKNGKRELSFLLDSTRFTAFFDVMVMQNEKTKKIYDIGRISDSTQFTSIPLNRFNADQTLQISYPETWEPQSKICELKGVPSDSIEFMRIKQLVGNPNICSITRIQNQHLWRRYYFERSFVGQKNNGKANEMELFHGTSSTKPKDIYNGEEGFDMRYSKTGRWGKGIYFANRASYSLEFGYEDIESGTKQLLFSRVAIGSAYACIEGNTSLKTPPAKLHNTNSEVLFSKNFYDSVVGMVGNTKIYTVYSNSKAYPSYLISFKN